MSSPIDHYTEGYIPVAVRDDRSGNTVISFSTEKRNFMIAVSGKIAGPFTLDEIKALKDNLDDIIEMKGRYLFISEYDVRGNKT